MKNAIGLRSVAALLALPFVVVVALSLQTAARGRHAFTEMTATLAALGETSLLEQTIRKGVGRQLLAATRYLQTGDNGPWTEFTELTWSIY